jgi:hypothetical protein
MKRIILIGVRLAAATLAGYVAGAVLFATFVLTWLIRGGYASKRHGKALKTNP